MYISFEGGITEFEQELRKFRCAFIYFWEPSLAAEEQTQILRDVEAQFDVPRYHYKEAGAFNSRFTVFSINVQEQTALRDQFRVEETPALAVYYRRKPITLATGHGLRTLIVGPFTQAQLEELAYNLININR